ncbi:MAG: tetraacyldisaccharide 4'-kinase [Elusimicrobia bacterium HGW-Elusimicrobia-1]|jgi:tetraacyldisaccharide 4'-kinase|nr:MAG: tetraacyldisaccharide 4'-kinase [Elusimicrobia bacterium HGW-Elusimicrobia-1]
MRENLSLLLAPLTFPYYLGYLAHRRLTAPRKFDCPVVSVGNITWGGSGKTPTVIKLAEDFLAAGRKVAVLSRGYAGKSSSGSSPLCVSDGNSIKASPEEAGDEPYLMAEKIGKAVILAGKNRAASAAAAIKDYGADVLILDDGFQRWDMARDLDIVCVDARNPFGNGLLIPAGILREPLSALGRAGLVALTNIDQISAEEADTLKKIISQRTSAPVVTARHAPSGTKNVFTGEMRDIAAAREVVGFSGIGNNQGFKKTLAAMAGGLKRFYPFADHRWYCEKDIFKMLGENPSAIFVTTLKDAVRFATFRSLPREKFFYADVNFEIVEGENAWREKLKPLF